MHIVTVVGARPQFIKAAVVSRAIRAANDAGASVRETIVHTGQHFDENMSDVFFEEMDIPRPDHHLGLGGGTHGLMTGRMLEAIEGVLLEAAPAWVLVYGDTNSTLAGALAAVKLHVPVAHVEAGLRSFDAAMPEEINRVLTDHAATLLLAPTATAVRHLAAEGIAGAPVALVGDVMYDAMCFYRGGAAARSTILDDLGLEPGGYVLATVHRAENTDDPARLRGVVEGLAALTAERPVVLPVHPRTRKVLAAAPDVAAAAARLTLVDPVGYLDMVRLESSAALIATDSGGVQKEAYFNGVPCVTLRDETEWTELVEIGANTLVGADAARIASVARAAIGTRVSDEPLYGDGAAGEAIVRILRERAGAAGRAPAARPAPHPALSPPSRGEG